VKVFLTGASGFVGSHAARVLLSADCQVLALVRPTSSLSRLQDILPRLTLIRQDLNNVSFLRQALEEWRPEACVHLAWYAEPGQYLHSPENIVSLMSSLSLLQELIRVGCARVVMTGTCAEYDADQEWFHEDSPTHPATVYAATKLAMYLIGHKLAQAGKIHFAWARLFYLYGPLEDDRRAVPSVIRTLLEGRVCPSTLGEQVRDYLHVHDVAEALWTLVRQGADGVFNISSGMPLTIRQLFETIGNVLGRTNLLGFGQLPYRDWEPMFMCGDNRRLRELGWSPRVSLKTGLAQTVDWWKAHI
jgi:nucleoside-diphosphate-sugar epimerase